MNWKSFQRCSVNNSLSSAEATVIQRDWVPLSTPYFSLCLHFLYSFFSVHLSLSDTHHSALWIKCDAINQNSRGIIVCSAHFNWDCAQIVQEITSFFLLFFPSGTFILTLTENIRRSRPAAKDNLSGLGNKKSHRVQRLWLHLHKPL